jgi:hypothetical protein
MNQQPLAGDVAQEKENGLGYCQSEDACRYESPEKLPHTLPIGLPVDIHGQIEPKMFIIVAVVSRTSGPLQ